jgi:ATP-dependent Zn protease
MNLSLFLPPSLSLSLPPLSLSLPPSSLTISIILTSSSGAQDDLDKVTQMAYRQVVEYGMSPTIGHISLPHKKPTEPAKRMYSDKLARMIDEVMDSILAH